MYPDSKIGGMMSRSLRLLNCRTAPAMVENMADEAKARKAIDMILGKAMILFLSKRVARVEAYRREG
jgi:hypothetical protein